MGMYDLEAFLRAIHPFSLLTKQEIARVLASMNIAYYKKETLLLSPIKPAEVLYIVIKGEVGEFQDDELIKVYSQSSSFDADALIYQRTESSFRVLEELICYELKKEDFLALLDANAAFKAYFIQDLANKIQSAKQKEYTTELSGFMMARVQDTYLHEPTIVEPHCSIMHALAQMEAKNSSCIIVQGAFQNEHGIVTDSIVRRRVLFNEYDKHSPIGPIALRPIITIEADDYLFNALLLFTKHSIKRLVVTKAGKIIGILEQLDLLSYFANHTYLVAVQIRKATSIEELKHASNELIHIVKKLQVKGTKVDYIAQLISEINEKIYEKLYTMIVPQSLAQKACLIVMGSEGRKEQMLKTDQDNALIIADDANVDDYVSYMAFFTQTLIDFGFPKCEGNIMVSNPFWCKRHSDYVGQIHRWFDEPNMEGMMNLAIFFDATAVAGEHNLLESLKAILFERVETNSPFLANFAKSAVAFETPIGLFTNFIAQDNRIDIKKGGIFPIVHGVRSLALEYKLSLSNTNARIKQLAKLEVIDDDFAGALIEALDTFLSLRLKERLSSISQDHRNDINLEKLNQLELELLKDSFKIVNKFKKFLTHHFKLSLVS